jgi:AraC family transcriptional regulator of adaptative response / methylphosphotriester-DNA alkyltransferase methyltransferase
MSQSQTMIVPFHTYAAGPFHGRLWRVGIHFHTRPVVPVVPTHRPITITLRGSLLRDAVAIVESEYDRDLDLDDVARRVATSRRQLQRAYSEIGNTTFRTHLTHVRMKRAAEMLQATSMSVRDVATRVGYRQPAQFAKAFRRHHGCSPSEYREHRSALSVAV